MPVSIQVNLGMLNMDILQMKAALEAESAKGSQAVAAAQSNQINAESLLRASQELACKQLQRGVMLKQEALKPLKEKLQHVQHKLKGLTELRELAHSVSFTPFCQRHQLPH